jgi:hypothetical protein
VHFGPFDDEEAAMSNDAPLTTAIAARLAMTSESTIRAAAISGKLPHIRTASGVRLFERRAVEQFARDRQNTGGDGGSSAA